MHLVNFNHFLLLIGELISRIVEVVWTSRTRTPPAGSRLSGSLLLLYIFTPEFSTLTLLKKISLDCRTSGGRARPKWAKAKQITFLISILKLYWPTNKMFSSDKYFNDNSFRNCFLIFPQATTKHYTCLFDSSCNHIHQVNEKLRPHCSPPGPVRRL